MSNQNEWQPIETAPQDGTPLRVMYDNDPDQIEDGVYWSDERSCLIGPYPPGWASRQAGNLPVDPPTHWMPLEEVSS